MGQTTLGLFDADVPAEAARLLWRLWGDESVALSFPHENQKVTVRYAPNDETLWVKTFPATGHTQALSTEQVVARIVSDAPEYSFDVTERASTDAS